MQNSQFTAKSELKIARKTLKFWFKVLLTTDLMNEKSDRIELFHAIDTIKQHTKFKSGR